MTLTRSWSAGAQRLAYLFARARAWRHGLRPGVIVEPGVSFGPRVRIRVAPGARLHIGARSFIDEGSVLAVASGAVMTFGAECFIGHHCTLSSAERILIEEGVYLAEMVSVRDHDHQVGRPPRSGGLSTRRVHVEPDAWLGSKSSVLRGAVVGAGSVVAAHSVVRGVVPRRVLVAGAPATIRRSLSQDGIG